MQYKNTEKERVGKVYRCVGGVENIAKQMIRCALQNDPWACNREHGYSRSKTGKKAKSGDCCPGREENG